MDRASDYGSEGCRFDSGRAHQAISEFCIYPLSLENLQWQSCFHNPTTFVDMTVGGDTLNATQPVQTGQQRMGSLDGFRGIAIIAVLGFHLAESWPSVPRLIDPVSKGGFIGVDMFFVLSGFLITTLLLREHQDSGKINFFRFFLRRKIRLMPPLLIFTLAALIWAIKSGDNLYVFGATVIYSIFSVINWALITKIEQSPHLGIIWSLSVEEQFYFLIAVISLVHRWLVSKISIDRFLVCLSCSLIIWSFCAKVLILHGGGIEDTWIQLYFRTDLRFDSFFIGVLASVYRKSKVEKPQKLINWTFAPSMVFLGWYMWEVDNGDSWNYQGGLTAVAIASAFVIMAASYQGTFANKIFSMRILRSIGLVSYSVYLIHVLVFSALSPANLNMNNKVRLLLALMIIFGYAAIVYFAVEKPLSRVRARLHVKPSGAKNR